MTFTKSLRLLGALSILSFVGCQAEQNATAPEQVPASTPAPSQMSADEIVTNIMDWWQGDYHNDAQIAALREDGAPIWRKDVEGDTFGGHLPVNSYYRSMDMPAFGEHVIYLEEFSFKENPYRQRIYTVIKDEETDQVRVKLWYFADKTTYAQAWQDTSRLQNLTPDDLSPLPDTCDLVVEQAQSGRLEMKMPKNKCKFGNSIFDYQVSLSPDDFWFRDRIVDADTMMVKSTAGSFQYHKLDKVAP